MTGGGAVTLTVVVVGGGAADDVVTAGGAETGAGLCVVCVACRCIHATAAMPAMSTTANAQNHPLGPLRCGDNVRRRLLHRRRGLLEDGGVHRGDRVRHRRGGGADELLIERAR
jgi:hypothetical protein